jgi:hypothetical protein
MSDKLDKMKINKESSYSDIQECIDLVLGSDIPFLLRNIEVV